MWMIAFVLFVALPLGGALVIGSILFFERLAARAHAGEQRAPAATSSEQGLGAGPAARPSQPQLPRCPPSAWAAITSGSHPRVVLHR